MTKVSVISGYYNRGEHLEGTVLSILNQSYQDLELIVFDDASDDGTKEVMQSLASKLNDARFRPVYHSKNRGFTQGMVDAIAESRGDYIAIQGSGDLAHPDRIAEQAAYLDAHPDVCAVGSWYTNVVAETGARRPRQPNADGIDFQKLLAGNVFSHGEVMMRRSVYERVGGYRTAFKNCQDYDLWLRMVKCGRLATIPKYLYDRYIRMDGVSYDPRKFLNQARYFLLVQRVAQMDKEQAAEIMDTLSRNGPAALVDQNDKALQARFLKAAIRSIIWGASHEAEALARIAITNRMKRSATILLARTLDARIGRSVRKVIQRSFGVQ